MDPAQRRLLLDSYDIPAEMLDRLLADIWDMSALTCQEWVQRRHAELQRAGHANERIWRQIADELPTRRFAAGAVSLRQLRRMVYG